MVTAICSIISFCVTVFLFVHNIILQRKLASIEHRIYMVHYKQAEMYANLYNAGEITKEEYDEKMEIVEFHKNYYLNGKA